MRGGAISGILGMIVGGVWFAVNFRHVSSEGFVAIGMPSIIFVLGLIYFIRGRKG